VSTNFISPFPKVEFYENPFRSFLVISGTHKEDGAYTSNRIQDKHFSEQNDGLLGAHLRK